MACDTPELCKSKGVCQGVYCKTLAQPEDPLVLCGWATVMHGQAVVFCSLDQKAAGMSPGATVPVYARASDLK